MDFGWFCYDIRTSIDQVGRIDVPKTLSDRRGQARSLGGRAVSIKTAQSARTINGYEHRSLVVAPQAQCW